MLCSGVGTCAVVKGKPRCSCPKGYWATPDGKGCDSSSFGGFTTYKLTWDRWPTWQVGLISLDSRKWKSGVLVERLKYNLYLDSGGRGLHRTAQQTWNLTPNGDQVTSLTVDDSFTQAKVSRRRKVSASFAKGAGKVSMQRGERKASHTVAYKGSRTPLPMFGGMEYPGWHVGCLSPAFYALALQRYDRKVLAQRRRRWQGRGGGPPELDRRQPCPALPGAGDARDLRQGGAPGDQEPGRGSQHHPVHRHPG